MLSPQDIATIEQALPILRPIWARQHLEDFCQLLMPGYTASRHARAIIDHLERLERREIRRLMIFLPPRHGKSLHVSELFPAWYLGRHPDHRVILACYGAELAEFFSRRCRALLQHPAWPFPTQLSEASAAAGRWDTTEGGGMFAAGVGGAMTGIGADLLIIDDPLKSRQEADSQLVRDRTWQWYQEVARTRLHPDGVMVLCMTRWHTDDLAGRILSSPAAADWTVLRLPAIAEQNDPLGRQPGEPLWPERFPASELPSVERGEISSRGWAALYQQSPTVDEGNIFHRGWWRRYRDLPPLLRAEIVVDSAFKTGSQSDYSVVAVWGTDGTNYFLCDLWRGRVEFPELLEAIRGMHARWTQRLGRQLPVVIEDQASGQSAIQTLRRIGGLPVIPYPVGSASKIARAEAVTPLVEAGLVYVPEQAPWVQAFIDEHAAFPGGAHDDMVDTTAMALARLSSSRPARFV